MKWPLVPRSLHDEVVGDLRARLDAAEAERVKLTQTITDMKVAGGTIPRPATGFRQEPREADAIEKALDENPRIAAQPGLRRHQLQWARKAIANGADEADIIARIGKYGTVTADDVDDIDEEDLIIG